MANMNVKKRLEKIVDELDAIMDHINFYSGIPKKDAKQISYTGEDIEKIGKTLQDWANDPSKVF